MSTTWAFGPNGIYTLTWDGVSVATVTLTAGGAFVASFVAYSLQQAMAAPEYQEILANAALPTVPLSLLAATSAAGFALQNGTPTILTWIAPSDGNLHRCQVFAAQHVTVAETGGGVSLTYNLPDGTAASHTILAAGAGTGDGIVQNNLCVVVGSGSTVSVKQAAALTVGAALAWAEIWGS